MCMPIYTADRSVRPFLHGRRRIFTVRYNAPFTPCQKCPSCGGFEYQSKIAYRSFDPPAHQYTDAWSVARSPCKNMADRFFLRYLLSGPSGASSSTSMMQSAWQIPTMPTMCRCSSLAINDASLNMSFYSTHQHPTVDQRNRRSSVSLIQAVNEFNHPGVRSG